MSVHLTSDATFFGRPALHFSNGVHMSKHLAVLKQAGIVADRKEGTKTFFRLKICCLQGLWECIESVLKDNLKAQRTAIGA